MDGRVLLYGILFQLCFLISIHVNSERSINGHMEFKYDFKHRDHSKAFMCLRRGKNCYFHNMTAQERIDVHDQEKILGIEVKILQQALHSPNSFIQGSKTLYGHDLLYFRGFCYHGNATLWLQK